MRLAEFFYDLPPERIAQEPVTPRDASRLMVLSKPEPKWSHRVFRELDTILQPSDVLVLNATRVFPARLRGHKKTGGKAELLLVGPAPSAKTWRVLLRGAKAPVELVFADGVTAGVGAQQANGEYLARFSIDDIRGFLARHGEMPLPPYIKRPSPRTGDAERYQTIFARSEGAIAAPTAGFHFTPELLDRLRARGIAIAEVILHVGWGTFRPVRKETIEDHEMLPERFEVKPDTAALLTQARRQGRRIIAVGTTVVRTLETIWDDQEGYRPQEGESNLFIYPGYRFRGIDGLITNFHLPDSTPLLLANAFAHHHLLPQGNMLGEYPFVLRTAYDEAIRQGYRFYSYGDAMAIL